MSVVRISGGLGNQLFQHAFAQSIQQFNGEESVYDLTEYRFPTSAAAHKLEINEFIFNSAINSPKIVWNAIPSRAKSIVNRKLRKRIAKESLYGLEVRRESDKIFDEHLKIGPGGYYVGNFISHQYWNDNVGQNIALIRKQLEEFNKIQIELKTDSIGIHVRRGDYILNQKTRRFHGYCKDAYYLNAVKVALDSRPYLKKVSIASDSVGMLGELRKMIEQLGLEVRYVTETKPIRTLISLAGHSVFVGSNSTFSWWAAALTEKSMAYFPKDWFATGDFGYSPETYFPFPVTTLSDALSSD